MMKKTSGANKPLLRAVVNAVAIYASVFLLLILISLLYGFSVNIIASIFGCVTNTGVLDGGFACLGKEGRFYENLEALIFFVGIFLIGIICFGGMYMMVNPLIALPVLLLLFVISFEKDRLYIDHAFAVMERLLKWFKNILQIRG